MMHNRQFKAGLVIFLILFGLLLGVILFRGVDTELHLEARLLPVSLSHPLGTDGLGRDLLSAVIYGTGVSLLTAFTVVTFSLVFGGVLGMTAGLAGGLVDMLVMRVVDVILAFPGLLLAIALAAFAGPGLVSMIAVLCFSSWVGYARLVRGEVLKYKYKEYVIAARSYNASFTRIVGHHMLPPIAPVLLVQGVMAIPGVILAESSLNYLGLGLAPEMPSLGQLIDNGMEHIFYMPLQTAAPGLVLFLLILGFSFLSQGLRQKMER